MRGLALADEGNGSGDQRRRAWVRVGAVRIDGFRALRDVHLRLDPDLTVLLGENNTGKSSVLEALGVALGGWRASEDDLHLPGRGSRAGRFTVEYTLEPEEGEQFDPNARAVVGNAVQRLGDSNREYVAVRVMGRAAGDGSGIDVERRFLSGWGGNASDLEKAVALRSPRVGAGVLDLVSFTLLDAKRDLVEDLRQRRTAWGRLLARLDLPEGLADEISDSLEELGAKVIGASAVLTEIREGLRGVRDALGSSIADVSLAPVPSRVEEIARAIDVLVSAPGGAAIPLRLQGMGSRSLAALMIFQAFVDLRLGADLGLEPLAVTALEEPEAHLHPHAQAAIARLIKDLPGQKLISTHATRVATAASLDQLRFVRRARGGIAVRSTEGPVEAKMARKIQRMVLRPNGDLLFSRLVIVGDGVTEPDALPVFARAHWDQDPDGLGVAFPEVRSMDDDFATELIGFLDDVGIPWIALVDGDPDGDKAIEKLERRVRRSLGRAREALRLPTGWAFERMLVESGFLTPIAAGLKALEDSKLAARIQNGHGHATDPGLLLDVLTQEKKRYGRPVAEAMVAETDDEGRPCMPAQVRELLGRADRVLGIA